MENNETIDNPEVQKNLSPTKSLILWWEKKRIYYNLFMVAIMVFSVYDLSSWAANRGVETIIGYALYFLFGANLFYTLGWITGLILHFLYKHDNWNHAGRWTLFILGTLFSILWMLIIFSDAIQYGLNL